MEYTWEDYEKFNDINRKHITEEAIRDSGKFVIMNGSDKPALLLCAVDGVDDYYWLIMRPDLNLTLSSCVGGYNAIEGDLPPELSVLKWLWDNDTSGLLERVQSQFNAEKEGVTFLTPIKVK